MTEPGTDATIPRATGAVPGGVDAPAFGFGFGSAFDQALTPTAVLTTTGELLRANPAFCRFLQRSPEELSGRQLAAFMQADDLAGWQRFLGLADEGRAQSSRSERRFLTPGGQPMWGEFCAVVLDAQDPDVRCVFLQIHELDARARAESGAAPAVEAELRASLASSHRLVAVTAHELRTPLTAMSGIAETLEGRWAELTSSNRLQLLGSLRRQTDRLIGLVSDLLVLSAVDAGAVSLMRTRVALGPLIGQAALAVGLDPASLSVRCPAVLKVNADPARVAQILVNLLANARQHGGNIITVEARGDDDGVTVVVADEGPGVAPDFVDHMWERFSRAADAGTHDPRGSGLGLAIVQELVQAHGGRAWYEPNQPRGARFGFWLPNDEGEIDLRGDGPVTVAHAIQGEVSDALSDALRDAPLTVFSVDPTGALELVAGRDLEPLGLHAGHLPGSSALALPVIGELVAEARRGAKTHQVVEIGDRAYEVSCRPRSGGGVYGTAVDVTDLHWEGRGLAHAASHDRLTSLPNRALLDDRLAMALSRLARGGGAVAVLFVDLDHFKAVNDELGHDGGDQLLVAAARRLAAVVRPGDTVARYSGDEFVVVCEVSEEGGRDAAAVAERIVSAFRLPFTVDGREVETSASVGVTVTSDPAADPGQLLRQADQRMYEAKGGGRARWQA